MSPDGPLPTTATFLPVGGRHAPRRGAAVAGFVGCEALETADGHGLPVDLGAPAGALTRTRADPADDAGQRQPFFDYPHGLGVVSAGDGRQVAGDVDARRAGVVAGRLAVGVVVGEKLVQARPAGLRDLAG